MRAMLRALRNIVTVMVKEFREFSRSPLQLFLSVFSPAVMFLLFSYGFTLDVKEMPFCYLDLSRTPDSRTYLDTFVGSPNFSLVRECQSLQEVHDDLQSDRVRFALVIPEDFSLRLNRNRNAEIQVLVNGTMASRAIVVKGYVEGMNGDYNRAQFERLIARHPEWREYSAFPIELLPTAWFNPSLESENFLVPGLAGITLFFFTSLLASVSLSGEKESGMIFNMYTSPLSRFQFIAGKALFYVGIGMFNFFLFFAFILFLFGVPFEGDFIALVLLTCLFVTASVGIGLFVATLVRSQVAALLITAIGTMLPGLLYSGLLMPIESMGLEAKFTAAIIPVSYYVRITQLIFLKGVGWEYLLSDALGIAVFTCVIYGATLAFFKKRIG